jgi:hypothetical protein
MNDRPPERDKETFMRIDRTLTLVVIGVFVAALLTGGAIAQDSEQPPAPAVEKRQEKDDQALNKWIQSCCEKLTEQNVVIRESAGSALVTVGKPALPALRKIADMKDTEQSVVALRLIKRIEGGGAATAGAPGQDGGAGAGQGRGGMQVRMADQIKKAKEELGLNDEQTSKVEECVKTMSEKSRELFQKSRDQEISREEMQEQMRALRESAFDSLKGVLSDEQIAKVKEMMGSLRMVGRRQNRDQ